MGGAIGAPSPDVNRLLPVRPGASWADHVSRLGPVPPRAGRDLIRMLDETGFLGRGGAGFPTHRKLAAVAQATQASRLPAVVVANCCEVTPPRSRTRC